MKKFKLLREKDNLTFEEFLQLPQINLSEDDYILAIRSSIKKTTIFLKRSLKDILVNAFNPTILGLHRANMDIWICVRRICMHCVHCRLYK